MSNHSPIPSPSPSLIARWWDEAKQNAKYDEPIGPLVATQAARWGADMELEACCEWFQEFYETESWVKHDLKHFRAARRPKPSLRELALESVKRFEKSGEFFSDQMCELGFIRKALEQLDD